MSMIPVYDANGNVVDTIDDGSSSTPGLSGDESDSWLSQLGGLFSSIGTTVVSGIQGTTTPRPPVALPPGSTYYNPNTGQVIGGTGINTGQLFLIGGAILVVVLLLRR